MRAIPQVQLVLLAKKDTDIAYHRCLVEVFYRKKLRKNLECHCKLHSRESKIYFVLLLTSKSINSPTSRHGIVNISCENLSSFNRKTIE